MAPIRPITPFDSSTCSAPTVSKTVAILKELDKFDTYLGNYGATGQSIEGLALILKGDIRNQRVDYANANIKLTKVDAVGHSMGGLISRYYSHGLTGDLPWYIMNALG